MVKKKIIVKSGGAGGCPPALLEGRKNKCFLYSVKPLALSGEEESALGFETVPQFLPPAKFKSGNKLVHRYRIATRLMILGIFQMYFLPKQEAL
jgi:hypothetical protein